MKKHSRKAFIMLSLATLLFVGCATRYYLKKEKCVSFWCEGQRLFEKPKYPVFLGMQVTSDERPHAYVKEMMIRPLRQEVEDALECQFDYLTLFKGVFTGNSYRNADYYLLCIIKKFDFPKNPYIPQFPSIIFPLTFEAEIEAHFVNSTTHEELWNGTPYSVLTREIHTQRDVQLLTWECLKKVLVDISEGVTMAMLREFPQEEEKPRDETEPVTLAPQQQQEQQMQQQMMGPTIVIGGQTVTGEQAVQVKEYGFMSFQSTPSGAEVYIENQLIGNTPISNLRFQAGSHNVTMKLAGYKPWVNQILVITGGQQTIKPTLEK